MTAETWRGGLLFREPKEPRRPAEGPLESAAPLPPLMRGVRRWWILLLIGLGLGQVVLAALAAWALVKMQEAPAGASPLMW